MHDIINDLITLSKIFKEGFTVYIDNKNIKQSNLKEGFIISIQTLIEIKNNSHEVFKNYKELFEGLIGGWYDKENKTYYIEKNIHVEKYSDALRLAIKYKQKAIWDINKGECIYI